MKKKVKKNRPKLVLRLKLRRAQPRRVKRVKRVKHAKVKAVKVKKILRKKTKAIKPKRMIKRTAKIMVKRMSTERYILNPNYEFFNELRGLVLKASPAEKNKLIKRITALGRIRLAIISGIFLNSESTYSNGSVADILIVGDEINRKRLRVFLRQLEGEVGREVRFSLMDKEEFDYRFAMFDRFVRVMLESPHEKIINKIGL